MRKKNKKNNISFSEIFQRKEYLFVIFSEDLLVNYRVVSGIIQWLTSTKTEVNEPVGKTRYFNSIYFIFPSFQKSFFEAVLVDYELKVKDLTFIPKQEKYNIVINLNGNYSLLKKWSNHSQQAIFGLGKQTNIKFVPQITDAEKICDKVSEFLGLPKPTGSLDLKTTEFSIKKINSAPDNGKYVLVINNWWKRMV